MLAQACPGFVITDYFLIIAQQLRNKHTSTAGARVNHSSTFSMPSRIPLRLSVCPSVKIHGSASLDRVLLIENVLRISRN